MYGVGGDHYPVEVEGFEQIRQGGDFVGLVRHSLLGQGRAGGVVQRLQEMRHWVLAGAGRVHGLAVHRDHCFSFDGTGACAQP